jgi:hypothetical protein
LHKIFKVFTNGKSSSAFCGTARFFHITLLVATQRKKIYNNKQGSLASDTAKLSSEYFEYRKAGYVTVAGFYRFYKKEMEL